MEKEKVKKKKKRRVRLNRWINPYSLMLSGFYEGRCSLREAARDLPEYCVTSTETIEHFIPIVNPERITPYRGNTGWAKAANELREQLQAQGAPA